MKKNFAAFVAGDVGGVIFEGRKQFFKLVIKAKKSVMTRAK